MIMLCQFPSPWKDNPLWSPLSAQVELYLRMSGLDYEISYVLDPRQAPQGRLPYIIDHDRVINDSTRIIEYLKLRYGDPLDRKLTREQIGLRIRIERLLTGPLLWGLIADRWLDERGWLEIEHCLSEALPADIRHVIPRLLRARVRRELESQGFSERGDRWMAEIEHDLRDLASRLGDHPYFLGAEPSSIDAAAFSVLASIWFAPVHSHAKEVMAELSNLQLYCERMASQYGIVTPFPAART